MSHRTIEELYAFFAEEPGGDGIVAVGRGAMMFPLVTGKPELLPRMREDAQLVANQAGVRVRLVRFIAHEEIETILPAGTSTQ